MKKVYTLALILISYCAAFGQGSIAGKITDAISKEPVIGATVLIVETGQGTASDIEGNFLISNVKEGTYTLQISSVTYKKHTLNSVIVETAKKITIDVSLSEDVAQLEEIVVQGTRQTDTDFDLLRTIKEARVIAVGITSEQISKSLDRDAAQVLKRVPGVTIKGDQFVQVRGLSERYNPVMLHNAYAPSVETDVRSFSFATLPSSQLDKMLVFKSPSADLPGDFAGGVVKVFTKSIPEENGFIVDYSTQIRSGTTFNDFYSQQKPGDNFTGFNSGYYDLPAYFPANVSTVSDDRAQASAKTLKNLWTAQKGTAIPDQRFTLTFNRKFKIRGIEIGNITALNYSNSFATYQVQRGDFITTGNKPGTIYYFLDEQYNQQVRTGLLFNWAFKFNDKNIVELKNLYNQSSNDQYVDRNGTVYESGSLQHRGAFDKVYRGIYSGQLLGKHELFNNMTSVEWVAGYNSSNRDQPDYKRYRQDLDPATGANAQIYVPNSVSPDFLGRFYSKLNESAYTGGFSIKQNFSTDNPLTSPELKAGMFFENKTREFRARNIGYEKSVNFNNALTYLPIDQFFQPQNIDYNTGLQIGENTNLKDNYSASNNLLAYYLMVSYPISSKLKLDAGARVENNLQKLNSFDFSGNPVNVSNQVNRLLPSANLSYNFTEKMLVRAAYGETLNRPEFRELAPFSFFDFNYNFVYFGNPKLLTAKIQNADLRFEYYPSKGEMITFGGFYKHFSDPIESIVDPSSPGGGVKNVSFQNAENAVSYGVEVEVRKSLAELTNSKFLDNMNVMFNATFIKSSIKIQDDLAFQQKSNRPLQGQAPYVINAGLFYASEHSGWQVNVLYNVVGKNIAFVGNDNYADVYIMPRNVIDLTFSKRISERFFIKGGISDILNQPMLLLQDGNGDGNWDRDKDDVIQSYKPGQVFSIGFSYKF